MKFKLLLTLSISLTMVGCASAPKLIEINNQEAVKENFKRVYFVRSNTKIKSVEKGMPTAAKVGLGILAVAAAGAIGANTNVFFVPSYKGKAPAAYQNIVYDIFTVNDGTLKPYQSFGPNEQPLFVDFDKSANSDLVLGVYNKSFLAKGYSSDISLLTIDTTVDGVDVVAMGKQESPDDWGMRVLRLSNEDARFCQDIQNRATTQKEVSEIIKARSANYVADDSNLKSSANFSLACYTIMDATRSAPYAGSEIRERFETKADKLISSYNIASNNSSQTANDKTVSEKAQLKIITKAQSLPPISVTPLR